MVFEAFGVENQGKIESRITVRRCNRDSPIQAVTVKKARNSNLIVGLPFHNTKNVWASPALVSTYDDVYGNGNILGPPLQVTAIR